MFELYEEVIILSNGLTGTIVDISTINGKTKYTVESDIKGKVPGGYGDIYPLFDCTEDQIKKTP